MHNYTLCFKKFPVLVIFNDNDKNKNGEKNQ